MSALAINVTDFSRGLSDFLNQVQSRGQVLDIERGKRVVARLMPAGAADGYPLDQLDAALARGNAMSMAERRAMQADISVARKQLVGRGDPWAS